MANFVLSALNQWLPDLEVPCWLVLVSSKRLCKRCEKLFILVLYGWYNL